MPTSNLSLNPFTDDFADGAVGADWQLLTSGSATIVEVDDAFTFTLPSGGSYRSDPMYSENVLANLPLFTADERQAMNDFVVEFKVTSVIIDDVSGKPAAGGLALVRNFDGTNFEVLPIIEFGGDANADKRAYHSWANDGEACGDPLDVAMPSLPFWVRVVRSDNVVYPMIKRTAGGVWETLAATAATGRLLRSTGIDSPDSDFNSIGLYARTQDASGSGLTFTVTDFAVVCWPYEAPPVQLANLQAKSVLTGNSIKLTWENPTGENAPHYVSIWRSRYGHPEFKRSPYVGPIPEGIGFGALGEEVYAGAPVSEFVDTGLQDDRFYYYTVFASRASVPPVFSDDTGTLYYYDAHPGESDWGPQAAIANKATGWSMANLYAVDGDSFYNLFPQVYRERDQQDKVDLGASTGYLERVAKFLQHGVYHHRGLVKGLGCLHDAAQGALGMVGAAVEQTSIVDALLEERGLRSDVPVLDGLTRRRLWEGAIGAYKKKGSRTGVSDFVTLLTGWRSQITQEPSIGSGIRALRTWDGYTTCTVVTTVGGLTFSAGQVSGFVGLTPHRYADGIYQDYFGNKKVITDNDATTLYLQDTTWVGYNEIVFTGTVTDVGQVQIDTGWPFTNNPNDDSYNTRGVLANDDGGSLQTSEVVDTIYTASPGVNFLTGVAIPTGSQTLALGYSYSGATFSARVVTSQCRLYSGGPSWLADTKADVSLVGLYGDPFFRLYAGLSYVGLGPSTPSGPTDLVIWAPAGAAKYPFLVVDSLYAGACHEVLVQDGPAYPDVKPGDWINPNRNQQAWFRIVQVDDSASLRRYRVALNPDGLSPSDVSAAGDVAVIAVRATRENDARLRAYMPVVLPWDVQLFVYYQ